MNSRPSTAREVIAALLAMGITLHVDGDRLRARPSRAVTPEIASMVRPLRHEILDALRGEGDAEEATPLFVGTYCREVPAYCPSCGNLDFYATGSGWHCAFCKPAMVADLICPTHPLPLPAKRPVPQLAFGPVRPCVPVALIGPRGAERAEPTSFFCADEIAATWPAGWTPPYPRGRSACQVATMSAIEREQRAAYWAEKIAFEERLAEFTAVASEREGRDAIIARQLADRQEETQ